MRWTSGPQDTWHPAIGGTIRRIFVYEGSFFLVYLQTGVGDNEANTPEKRYYRETRVAPETV